MTFSLTLDTANFFFHIILNDQDWKAGNPAGSAPPRAVAGRGPGVPAANRWLSSVKKAFSRYHARLKDPGKDSRVPEDKSVGIHFNIRFKIAAFVMELPSSRCLFEQQIPLFHFFSRQIRNRKKDHLQIPRIISLPRQTIDRQRIGKRGTGQVKIGGSP